MTPHDRGKRFERDVAASIRKKLGARVQRDKRSGAGIFQKADIVDYFRETGLHVEAKSQETVKIKEFYRQAKAGASYGQAATVVFRMEEETLACLSFNDLLDIVAERNQLQARVRELEAPVQDASDVAPASTLSIRVSNTPTCRNGHLVAPGTSKCLFKGCQYSSSYKAKKEKK